MKVLFLFVIFLAIISIQICLFIHDDTKVNEAKDAALRIEIVELASGVQGGLLLSNINEGITKKVMAWQKEKPETVIAEIKDRRKYYTKLADKLNNETYIFKIANNPERYYKYKR